MTNLLSKKALLEMRLSENNNDKEEAEIFVNERISELKFLLIMMVILGCIAYLWGAM